MASCRMPARQKQQAENMHGLVLVGGLGLNPKIAIHNPEFFATEPNRPITR